MFCPNCGKEITNPKAFCPACGTSLEKYKAAFSQEMTDQEPFTVQKHNLDTHHHVNNCQYIRIAADYLPEDFKIHQMRAEYKKQAVLGDVFYPRVHTEPGKVVVALETNEGESYAVVEFQEK